MNSCLHEDIFIDEHCGDIVCTKCGLILQEKLAVFKYLPSINSLKTRPSFLELLDLPVFKWMTYQRKYHINEKFAQVTLNCPAIPFTIMLHLIEFYFTFRTRYNLPVLAKDLEKKHIALICNKCPVPYNLQWEFQSKKFKRRRMTSFSRFSERWYYFKACLCGTNKSPLPGYLKETLLEDCYRAERIWNVIRHLPSCINYINGTRKPCKCRKSFLDLNFVLHQLCLKAAWEREMKGYDGAEYLDLLNLFPVNMKPVTLTKNMTYWHIICDYHRWEYWKYM